MKQRLVIGCVCLFLLLSACSVKLTGEQILDKVINAKSYYVEYMMSHSNSHNCYQVKEWYQAPNDHYLEVYLGQEKIICVRIEAEKVTIKAANLDNALTVNEYPFPTLLKMYCAFEGLTAHKSSDNYYMSTAVNQKPVFELKCDQKGLPMELTIKNTKTTKKIEIKELDLNCKHDQCIFTPLGT